MHYHATTAAGLLAAVFTFGAFGPLGGFAPTPAAHAVQLGELDDCRSTIETFPAGPCTRAALPKDARQAMKRVRVLLLDPANDDVPDRAARVAFQLDRADAATERAAERGTLPEACAEVVHDQIRYAQACVARPLLEERARAPH